MPGHLPDPIALVAPARVRERARAKVNLCLHVTGRRTDGYHLLDSLVTFAEVGDEITAEPAPAPGLVIDGPFAAGLDAGPDNLVLRAARAMGGGGAAIRLTKNLPVASGIGGGSADAAATLRALARLRGAPLPEPAAVLALGADVPVCLAGQPTRMSGIGEVLEPLALPSCAMVLVNPGVAVPTGAVFARLARRDNPPLPAPGALPDAAALFAYLRATRNDLEPAARDIAPEIDRALTALAGQPGCALARMSGSGATCFGLFATAAEAEAAAAGIRAAEPGWWVA
ncbi:MAG: 4-(cytidine 5'-diphospho)-2-C-methyl-D-erythritol kinase [Rhodovulum sulfidophilum]|uniref:4-diphosphocytidyl-2-C-methyl-D-erythritol kinase n=1 Tax=Rhodovulum sulfidophilum TaxID=35806 RepID=A0A2W5QBT4_RHOSU|nr:MAG: 4-(cytidine 5'-diphospho)-2-C-methyl-D-erythritol kinase [Rhodovulum sulfidophilum]